ncbi:MAG TPA: TetR/AcrR family transcriptional regulator [Nannocystis sp.]
MASTEKLPDPAACSPKRRQILAGARQVFAEMGFERASVDLIAARTGVSKATLYNHFHDKKALFVACFSEEADALREQVREALLREPEGELATALQAVGEQFLAMILTPAIVSLWRHTSAEAARFPEIGQMLFDRGPGLMIDGIAGYLQRWIARGALRITDVRAAAVQFFMLCHGDLMLRSQLGILPYPADDQIREVVRGAVAVFVRAYQPPHQAESAELQASP